MKLWVKILIGSIVIWVLGAVPLLLYVEFGPEEGNPVGLGLLYLAGQVLGMLGITLSVFMFLGGLLSEACEEQARMTA